MYYNLMVYSDTLGLYVHVASLGSTYDCIRYAVNCGYNHYKVTTLKWNVNTNKYENRVTYEYNE